MNPKKILSLAALISAIAALLGVFYKKNESPPPPQIHVQPQPPAMNQGGANNIQIAGSGNSLHVSQKETPKSVPTCEGFFPDLNDDLYKDGKIFRINPEKMMPYESGEKFYSCVSDNEGRIIKLSVWLGDKRLEEAERHLKSDKQIYFHVGSLYTYSPKNDYYSSDGGAEYMIELGSGTDANFVPTPRRLTTISGYYKMSSIIGPFQGAMSVVLKGVRIEDTPTK